MTHPTRIFAAALLAAGFAAQAPAPALAMGPGPAPRCTQATAAPAVPATALTDPETETATIDAVNPRALARRDACQTARQAAL